MNFVVLKRVRVAVALLFLAVVSVVFLDFRNSFGADFYEWAVSLQFVPSLLKTITISGFIGIGLVSVLLLTIFFGRVYCSAICPLGIFQDVVSWFSRKVKKKNRYKFSKAWTITRYTLLGITLLFLIFGGITFVTLLDPYSLFGRISSYIFKPFIVVLNNLGANGLSKMGIYSFLYRYDPVPVHWGIMLITALFLAFILILSFQRGRLYCNTICPVGTFLGFISKFSIFKIELDKLTCTKCGKCAKVCKSECINLKTQEIDYSRCVACYNCLAVCPEDAAKYRIVKNTKAKKAAFVPPVSIVKEMNSNGTDMGKRNFLIAGVVGTTALLGLSKFNPAKGNEPSKKGESTIPEDKTSPVSPPGSRSIEHLNDRCTGCSLCITACPTKVLQPSFMEYGLIGIMQPHMDFHVGLCNFDCKLCSEVCPTGAIMPLTIDEKHVAQTGIAQFDRRNCIVKTEGTDCGACSEHCPTKAVHMIPFGDLFIPEVTDELCIGCGACEYACPTRPFRAIYVDGNKVHQVAKKPETEKAKTDLKADEFPF